MQEMFRIEVCYDNRRYWIDVHSRDGEQWEFAIPDGMKLEQIAENVEKKFVEEPLKFKTIEIFYQKERLVVNNGEDTLQILKNKWH